MRDQVRLAVAIAIGLSTHQRPGQGVGLQHLAPPVAVGIDARQRHRHAEIRIGHQSAKNDAEHDADPSAPRLPRRHGASRLRGLFGFPASDQGMRPLVFLLGHRQAHQPRGRQAAHRARQMLAVDVDRDAFLRQQVTQHVRFDGVGGFVQRLHLGNISFDRPSAHDAASEGEHRRFARRGAESHPPDRPMAQSIRHEPTQD